MPSVAPHVHQAHQGNHDSGANILVVATRKEIRGCAKAVLDAKRPQHAGDNISAPSRKVRGTRRRPLEEIMI